MATHIVSNYNNIQKFKRSKFFKQNLGLVATVERNGKRVYNDSDRFSNFFNMQYKTTIYGQGNIGDIKFYTDHYIKDNSMAVYFGDNFEEFIFNFDDEIVKEKGIDHYIGKILKTVEEEYEERAKKQELKKLEEKPEGNPDKITMNPGQVTHSDIKAYIEKKRKERYGK